MMEAAIEVPTDVTEGQPNVFRWPISGQVEVRQLVGDEDVLRHAMRASGRGFRVVFTTAIASLPFSFESDESEVQTASWTVPLRVERVLQVRQHDIENVVRKLQYADREDVAHELLELQEELQQEAEVCEFNTTSLWLLTDVLADHDEYADPALTADHRGMVYAEWRIAGNGILVWGFLEKERVLVIAQADVTSIFPQGLDVNERLSIRVAIEEYGKYVPARN